MTTGAARPFHTPHSRGAKFCASNSSLDPTCILFPASRWGQRFPALSAPSSASQSAAASLPGSPPRPFLASPGGCLDIYLQRGFLQSDQPN